MSVKKKFGSDIVETSCEINPDVISFDDIEKIMKSEIITRLSLGIQSFSRKAIDFIGRIQSEDFDEKIKFIFSQKKNKDISCDFVCGLPDKNKFGFKSMEKLVLEKADHLSFYMLSVSERFEKKVCGKLDEIEKKSVEDFKYLNHILGDYGFERYEISNFAKNNKKCLHNLHYWKYDDYAAAGAGATMKISDSLYKYPVLSEYIINPDKTNFAEKECLSKKDSFINFLLMNLRLCEGINFDGFKNMNNFKNLINSIQILYNKYSDYMVLSDKNLKLNYEGFLIFNCIASDLMLIMEEQKCFQ